MNTYAKTRQCFIIPILAVFLALGNASQAQGKVVINEFMAWPGEACAVTAEFIELKNLGPGPVNIGCYVITDGDFSITIPANTILQPDSFYVLGGQNTINAPCANINKNVTVHLNWNTCGCTSGPIPTTNDGFMTDGGSAGEQLVLFNAAGIVIDAVVRKIESLESANTITTAAAGGCSPFTFDLDNLTIKYEEIGESQGRGNSFARIVDGDCKWEKESWQNAGETNKNNGATSTLSMTMLTTLNVNCITGNAVFTVTSPSPATYFPMTYTLGYDNNQDGQFSSQDIYANGTDSTSPGVELSNLSLGKYNIVIEPVAGCNQQFFTFELGPCATMDIKLKEFIGQNIGKYNRFHIVLETDNDMKLLQLESSLDGSNFLKPKNLPFEKRKGLQSIQFHQESGGNQFFRLAMTDINGKVQYSNILHLVNTTGDYGIKIAPNTFHDFLGISEYGNREDVLEVKILSTAGQLLIHEKLALKTGQNNYRLITTKLPKGIYIVQLKKQVSGESQISRIIKN